VAQTGGLILGFVLHLAFPVKLTVAGKNNLYEFVRIDLDTADKKNKKQTYGMLVATDKPGRLK